MKRPVLVYDGDCGFCRVWIERWRAATGDAVEYAPSSSAASRFPDVAEERFAEAVWLFEPGGRKSSGAEAVLRALSRAPGLGWLAGAYARVPLLAPVSEACYRVVARNRVPFSRLTRFLWGGTPVPSSTALTSRLVVAGLGLCFLLAFASLLPQLRWLFGSQGLIPAGSYLDAAREALGPRRFLLLPTLAWAGATDAALLGMAWAGAAASLGMIAGVAAGPCAALCWALYLSLCVVGGDFMSFQWDALLLEAGLIACFLAPWSLKRTKALAAPPAAALWLLRLLLVKLMLESGAVKLLSGDEAWRGLTALTWHWWTQPLPTPLAWHAARLPLWAQKGACGLLFAIELGAPLLILAPRRARAAGAGAIAFLMVLVAATGNYGIFNLLTLVLCVACLDDRLLGREKAPAPAAPAAPPRRRVVAARAFAALWLVVSATQALALAGVAAPRPVRALEAALSPFRSISRYGLFAVMTKTRDEIALEVSADGAEWRERPFPWKPGDPRRAPPLVAPHMPRLDWQMWFASLGQANDNPWFGNLLFRVLEGGPAAAALLGPDPLGGAKPLYARATRYTTRFTTPSERRTSGAWWTRERAGLYFPVVSLKR